MPVKGHAGVAPAATPEAPPLEAPQILLAGLRSLGFQQLPRPWRVLPLPALLRQAHLRGVEVPASLRPLRLGHLPLLVRDPPQPIRASRLHPLRKGQAGDHGDDECGNHRGPQQAAAERRPLPPPLRARHVEDHPLAVEHSLIDPVAHPQAPFHHPRHPGEPQQVDERVRVIHRYPLAVSHPAVQFQKCREIRATRFAGTRPQQSFPHEQQVIILFAPGRGEK